MSAVARTTDTVEVFGKATTLADAWLGEATAAELAVLRILELMAHNYRHTVTAAVRWLAEKLARHPATIRKALAAWIRRGVIERLPTRATETGQYRIRFEMKPSQQGLFAAREALGAPARPTLDQEKAVRTHKAHSESHGGGAPLAAVWRDFARRVSERFAARATANGRSPVTPSSACPPVDLERLRGIAARLVARGRSPAQAASEAIAAEARAREQANIEKLRLAGVSAAQAVRAARRFPGWRIAAVLSACARAGPANPGGWIRAALWGGWRVSADGRQARSDP